MMGWIIALGLCVTILAALAFVGRIPRATWEMTAAALLLGLAGYAWQGQPSLAGEPRRTAKEDQPFDEGMAERRRAIAERFGPAGQWLMMSDALGRQGKTREAANILQSGLRQTPNDPNLWLGLGNALVAHGGGIVSPGADYAYRRAIQLDPTAPAAPYFYGLALARSGEVARARALWAPLAARAPRDSEIRAELEQNIRRIDAMLAGNDPVVP
ncbi:tetratricopeptide repeat protein [Sphingobium sp. AN641]|uniref:tetratricopeptide repeat protein n=1 Tax=Sphingobium sp. AN641 TaxID=3133443 RepID=UPI0030BDE3E9